VLLLSAILGCVDRAAPASRADEPPRPPITALAFSPDGERLVVGSNAGVRVLSWPELKLESALETRAPHVHHLAFAQDGAKLAVVGGTPAEQGLVELFAWPRLHCLARFVCHTDVLYGAAWHPQLDRLAVGGAGGRLAVLDASTGSVTQECHGHVRDVLAVCWLPEGWMASASADQSLRLWPPAAGEAAHVLSNHTAEATALAVPPSPPEQSPPRTQVQLVSIGRDRTVRLWQPLRRRLVRFVRLRVEPLDVCWTHVPDLVAVACTDGRVRLVDVRRARVHMELPAVEGWAYCVRQHADRSLVVGGERGQLVQLPWPNP
jgi:WD40 repeat protein